MCVSTTAAWRCRSPHGECGLKSCGLYEIRLVWTSLPTRGVWIEIAAIDVGLRQSHCRSPHGECGLKSQSTLRSISHCQSLPTRGVWIEIRHPNPAGRGRGSLPTRGVWIEMARPCVGRLTTKGSLPTRGVWIEMAQTPSDSNGFGVAPHTGSVD